MGLLTRTFLLSLVACCYRSAAKADNYEPRPGKKLPVTPFETIKDIGFQMCFKECKAYSRCLSINYNLIHFICELNSVRENSVRPLINDQNYAYHEIPHPANRTCGKSSCYYQSKCVQTSLGKSVCLSKKCFESWCFYEGRSYYFSNQLLSWQNAKENCNQMYANLVEIESAEENHWIISMIPPSQRHWIGLTNLNPEGDWLWEHSRAVHTIGRWDSFQTNGDQHSLHDCVDILYGKWNNWPCSDRYHFICEK